MKNTKKWRKGRDYTMGFGFGGATTTITTTTVAPTRTASDVTVTSAAKTTRKQTAKVVPEVKERRSSSPQ